MEQPDYYPHSEQFPLARGSQLITRAASVELKRAAIKQHVFQLRAATLDSGLCA
jgi:hypothetical protein